MTPAVWFLVAGAVVLLVFVWSSLRALRADGGELADRVAQAGFYACLFVAVVLLLGMFIYR